MVACLLGLALWGASSPARAATAGAVVWERWSDALFERARAEQRFVLLELEAVWCHWCHVMDETTYRDPEVVRLIGERYIAVRVDQDSHPELSQRYEDYGWPATIFFAPDGSELVRRRGYLPPPLMRSILEEIIKDPTPGPSVKAEPEVAPVERGALSAAQRRALAARHLAAYDRRYGGWGRLHKFIQLDLIEWTLVQARQGDAQAVRMARQTLDAALQLIDPVWGGIYQYSDALDWRSPHFEKIMSSQTQALRSYALAYGLFGERRYLEAAQQIARYLTGMLRSPEGAFYTSQDADLGPGTDGHRYYRLGDAERRRLGLPRIDKNIYPRENGWAIEALVELYAQAGDREALAAAERAAAWIRAHRRMSQGEGEGGFRRGEDAASGVFLGDTLAMGQALLALHAATGDRAALAEAEAAARFIDARFRHAEAGFVSAPVAPGRTGALARPSRPIDENVQLVRFANRLHQYTGEEALRRMAEHAMRYLGSPALVESRRLQSGLLLADHELGRPPVHITVVGGKDDPQAAALFAAALRYPALYKRTEWWDRREGALRHADVPYPELGRPAAFACGEGACSLPVYEPAKLAATVDRLAKPPR